MFKVSENSPIKDIRWTKNNWELQVPGDKYRGGEKADSCFTILMAGEDDMGLYTCTVWNAVGSVSKNIKLGTTLLAKYILHFIFINFDVICFKNKVG